MKKQLLVIAMMVFGTIFNVKAETSLTENQIKTLLATTPYGIDPDKAYELIQNGGSKNYYDSVVLLAHPKDFKWGENPFKSQEAQILSVASVENGEWVDKQEIKLAGYVIDWQQIIIVIITMFLTMMATLPVLKTFGYRRVK